MNGNYDFAIVGAGPVGLWTSIQIKKRCPQAKVIIFERYATYKRSHIIKLDHISTLLYCKHSKSPRERQFFEEISRSRKSLRSVFIKTNELEQSLRRYATDLGVVINYKMINHPSEVEALCQNAKCFIAADGARSKIRTSLLGEPSTYSKPMKYVVELKYEAKADKPGRMSFFEKYKTSKIMSFMAFEFIGRSKEGITPVTIRFFVDKKTYEELPEANFKSPLMLDQADLPERLGNDINTYMNVRKKQVDEVYMPGSGKLTKLVLSNYRARKFSVKNPKPWFFVGDAAFGIPFFRALNSGFLCGSLLSASCCKILKSSNRITIEHFRYSYFMTMRYLTEAAISRFKNAIAIIFDIYRKFWAKMPWQMNLWSDDEKFEYLNQRHYAFSNDSEETN